MPEIFFIFVRQLSGLFLMDPSALSYAMRFSRILLSTSFLFGLFFVLASTLQAMGEARGALIVNLSRQGFIFIPALLILNSLVGLNGLIWAQPIADVLSTALVILTYLKTIKKTELRATL